MHTNKKKTPIIKDYEGLRDSAGTRTQNLRLRRALLYPVELPNHSFFAAAKIGFKFKNTKYKIFEVVELILDTERRNIALIHNDQPCTISCNALYSISCHHKGLFDPYHTYSSDAFLGL